MIKKNKLIGYSTVALTGLATVMKVVNPIAAKAEASYNAAPFVGFYMTVGGAAVGTETESVQTASNIPTAVTNESSSAVETNFVGFEESATTIIGRVAAGIVDTMKPEFSPVASLGGNYSIGGNWLMGLEATFQARGNNQTMQHDYTLSTVSGGTKNGESTTITNTSGVQSIQIEDGATISLAVKPTYALSPNLAVYGKLAYYYIHDRDVEVGYSTSSTFDKTFHYEGVNGYGAGLGATWRIWDGFFIDIGADYVGHDGIGITQNDSLQTATLTSLDLTSVTHTMGSDTDTHSLLGTLKFGWRF